MEEKVFITHSARETEEEGLKFAKKLKPGDLVILSGALGAGKTTFVQGVAKGFLVKSRVISPTFVLLRTHRGKKNKQDINLYHIDLYRLEGKEEIKTLGLDDIFDDVKGIFIIEWGEKHSALKSSWEINFEILSNNMRRITLRNYT